MGDPFNPVDRDRLVRSFTKTIALVLRQVERDRAAYEAEARDRGQEFNIYLAGLIAELLMDPIPDDEAPDQEAH
jgi:hypothetical protein